jgi:putative ABC transport system permease protein
VFAACAFRRLRTLVPPDFPRTSEIGIDGGVLLFTGGVTLLAALFFGIIPALRGSRTDIMGALRTRGGGAAHQRTRSALVVLQVALSFVLVVAAGLMGRSFLALRMVDPGFRPEGALTLRATLPPGVYPTAAARTEAKRAVAERLAGVPNVLQVGGALWLPLGGSTAAASAPYGNEAMLADGDESDLVQAFVRNVLPGYFDAMETEVVEGRVFDDTDLAEDSVRHVVVDRALAEKAWPGESAIGKRLYVKVPTPGVWVDVIGVVEHQRHGGLTGESQEAIYFSDHSRGSSNSVFWILRTDGDPLALIDGARAAISEVDPRITVEDVRPLTDVVHQAETSTRTILVLSGAFGMLALLLAAIGLYGVIAFLIRERTREIGIRVALGAQPRGVMGMVLSRGLTLVAVGVILGFGSALGTTQVLETVLVGTEPNDPVTLATAAAVFVLVALFACAAPAGRALRVSPLVALRDG